MSEIKCKKSEKYFCTPYPLPYTLKHSKRYAIHGTILLRLLLFFLVCFAATYYVDIANGSDSVLELSRTGGYAELSDADVDDLDYSKDFSVEALARIEAFQRGGRWGTFIQKGGGGMLWNSSTAGFGIGTYTGNEEAFSKSIMAKIGDGYDHISITSRSYQGYVYAVMTWDFAGKTMILYINGENVDSKTNSAITPANIKNNESLKIGKDHYKLWRNVFTVRLWNRKLSPSEISSLWDNYNTTGQHILPSGFDNAELKSEWLMQQTSDATGSPGTTHIKDTKGTNHLELKDGAKISTGIGYLTVENPPNGAMDVDKAVMLRVKGGLSNLSSVTKPLHYYFQIDEFSSFSSFDLKESGWIKHYGQWKPILKPNTQYYWRVKVKDSSSPPNESSYIATQSFTTEGPSNWYVRPLVETDWSTDSLNNPITDEGVYGSQDGTSYANAWNGIDSIKWGEDGVEAGDTLHICGTHIYYNYKGYWDPPTRGNIKESGFSSEYPIIIRTDCFEEEGVLWGIAKDMNRTVTWNGPDANDVYWTRELERGAAVEYNGTDYIWLDSESNTTWTGHYGAAYHTMQVDKPWLVDTAYVKTTDGSDPTGKIYYSSPWGFHFDMGRSSFIKFYRCTLYNNVVKKNSNRGTVSELPVSKNITFDSCDIGYRGGTLIGLGEGMDNWIVRNCNLHHAGNGIYTSTPGHVYNLLVENNMIHDIGPPGFPSSDCHAIGVQNGANHIFQNNIIWNTGGTAIEFWACNYTMKNMTVRNNFIKDTYVRCKTGANGISISGCNSESWGRRTGFKVYNNIIMNTALEAPDGWWGGTGISSNNKDFVEVYNNIIVNPYKHGISFAIVNPDSPPQGAIYNNIIVNPGSKYLNIYGVGDWSNFSCDYNLYYPTADFTTDFYFRQSIDRDNNSILADPMFVSPDPQEPADFMLQPDSPAIDEGVNVGLSEDFNGNPVPQGNAPDIGAYEYGSLSLRCDINKDGKINIQDVQACVNHMLDKQDWGKKADVNKDWKVDGKDVEEILTTILKQ